MNERITEAITRELLTEKGYTKENGFIVEEQKSKNTYINNSLKEASKSGDGRGYPEFIIQKESDKDMLMVIECKADRNKHVSEDLNKINEYAVDGAIHYAKHLANKRNVLAVGISGQTKEELKVDIYLVLKETKVAIPIESNNLLLDYKTLSGETPIVKQNLREKESELLLFSERLDKKINDEAKLSEKEKPILVSAILLALKNETFKISYKSEKTAYRLAKSLYNRIISDFEDANLPENKINNLKQSFGFLTVHPELTKGNILMEIIESLETKLEDILDDKLSHIDIIGKFYGEFLNYSSGDGKGLGIVLTPRHITEFFCDITQVNKDSIVIDTCQGTGGFLISAMNRMVDDAGHDIDKIKDIKSKQIIGSEQQPHMYTLGVSNMVLRGDGKANIYMGSCFDLKDQLKVHEPTIGLLNPPYSQKGDGLSEYHFIMNMLDIVKPGGKVATIVPVSVALDVNNSLREDILEKHTLDAVFTMPEELFYPVGTTTCVMVFKVGEPHPKGFKTFFGYYKDDGFVKTRNRGRIDLYDKFESEIKDKWVQTYINREDIPGFSIKQEVTAKDEWLAEAYMETDFSTIEESDFDKEIRKYMSYLLQNDLIEENSEETEKIKEEE